MIPRPPARSEAGFTLIELMISLGLFALIAVAGLALVDGIIGVQGKTEARLDRLAELQRAMFVVTSDLDQIAPGKLSGGGGSIAFTRAAPGAGGPTVPVRYGTAGGALVRLAGPVPQPLLGGVTSVRWRFWDKGWVNRWPVSDARAEEWPKAVEVELLVYTAGGVSGTLRRVVVLPARVVEKQP